MNDYAILLIMTLITWVVLLILTIKRKYYKFQSISILGLLLGCAVFFGMSSLSLYQEDQLGFYASKERVDYQLIRKYLVEGNLGAAQDAMERLPVVESPEEASESTLLKARIAVLSGAYEEALVHYEMLGNSELDEWIQLKTYMANAHQNSAQVGQNSSQAEQEALIQRIHQSLDDEFDQEDSTGSDALRKIAKYASEIETYYQMSQQESLSIEENANSDIEKIVKKMNNEMAADLSFNTNENLRITRLKGYLLIGEYDEIAKAVDESASTEELMIVSELYLNDMVNEGDFSEAYDQFKVQDYNLVMDQVDWIVDKKLDDEPKRVRKAYQETLDVLESYKKNSVLEMMKKDIYEHVQDEVTNTTSKAYLQLSKIDQALGNQSSANEHISTAIETSYASNDDAYKVPMEALLEVITSSENKIDHVKEISSYVDTVLDHSVPFDANEWIEPLANQNQDQTQNQENLSFNDFMKVAVVKKTATITIGHIDASNYPSMRVKVQINENDELKGVDLKDSLNVMDTYENLDAFKFEKVNYNQSNIVLLCDVSGSMDENVDILKNTIIEFSNQMNDNEAVSVVGFDDTITFSSDFSADPGVVASYADQIGAFGGTNMYGALMQMDGRFENSFDENNVVILLTDGMDSTQYDTEEIFKNVRQLAENNGLTVYTVGLGSSVNSEYLYNIAEAGNGSFIYVDNEVTLNSFYDFIHTQATNQYALEYTVENVNEINRVLNLSMDGSLATAQKSYSVGDIPGVVDQIEEKLIAESNQTKINGLITKQIYSIAKEQTIQLSGEKLKTSEKVEVQVSGPKSLTLEATVVDETTIELMIPAHMKVGTYDLHVKMQEGAFKLENELTVVDANYQPAEFQYGDYRFKAMSKKYSPEGHLILSGNVVMNDYLRFKGNVIIEYAKDLSQSKLRVVDEKGCYITFDYSSVGLAKTLGQRGIASNIGKLTNFYIYSDPFDAEDYDDFPYSMNPIESLKLDYLTILSGNFRVYPEFVELNGFNLKLALPMQDVLFKHFPNVIPEEKMTMESSMLISSQAIGFDGKIEYENVNDERSPTFKLGKLPLGLNAFSFEFDTTQNNYDVEIDVGLEQLGDIEGLTVQFGIANGRFDSIGMQSEGPEWTVIRTPIPVTFKDFGFKLEGFANRPNEEDVSEKAIEILFEAEVADLTDYLPKIKKLLKLEEGFPLIELEDASVKTSISEFNIDITADAKLMTLMDIGNIRLVLGKFDYTNTLIGYNDVTQYGMMSVVKIGTEVEMNSVDMSLYGTGEMTLGYPYTGTKYGGEVDFDIGWNVLKKDVDVSGEFMFGVYMNSQNKLQFSIIVDGKNGKGKQSGFHLWFNNDEKFEFKKY